MLFRSPMMFLLFQRPEYKKFSFSWLLAARNQAEAKTILNICNLCKNAASPTNQGVLMGYPQVALIKINDDNLFGHLKFKPCVITSVSVNHTPLTNPSFFEDGAPVLVNLTLNLMEMQWWFRGEF